MKIPTPNHSIGSMIDKHHQQNQERPRPHMGASQLGHDCDRWLWLNFRWAVIEQFEGRILRLFRRGHNEEKTIVSDLRAIGVDIRQTETSQHRVDFGCHVSGSVDGVIMSGVPAAPHKKHVAEFKTHSKKSFDHLVANGVEKSKPMHYVQMQVYMLGMGIDRALYIAVCKDDDRLYEERVRLDPEIAQRYVNRGKSLALEDMLPPPISQDPAWYQCKFCPAYRFCHQNEPISQANCRTCSMAEPKDDSSWYCHKWQDTIPTEAQYNGCDYHLVRPDLVPWQVVTESHKEGTVIYKDEQGKTVKNGYPVDGAFSSKEILANPKACFSGDVFLGDLRDKFDAKVIG